MTLRCALYARYSSDQQRAASIEDQFPHLPRARGTRGLEDRRRLQGRRGLRLQRDPAPRRSGAAGGCGARDVRRGARRGARPGEPRPGGRGGSLQASPLRGGRRLHPGGGRDRRAPCGSQGDDERAVPEGPRGQDAPGPAGPGGGGQGGRQPGLRLRGGEGAGCLGRAGPGRAPDRRGAGRHRAPHLP